MICLHCFLSCVHDEHYDHFCMAAWHFPFSLVICWLQLSISTFARFSFLIRAYNLWDSPMLFLQKVEAQLPCPWDISTLPGSWRWQDLLRQEAWGLWLRISQYCTWLGYALPRSSYEKQCAHQRLLLVYEYISSQCVFACFQWRLKQEVLKNLFLGCISPQRFFNFHCLILFYRTKISHVFDSKSNIVVHIGTTKWYVENHVR